MRTSPPAEWDGLTVSDITSDLRDSGVCAVVEDSERSITPHANQVILHVDGDRVVEVEYPEAL